MNQSPDQFDPDDAALDALLSEASWPTPDPASTRRLARFYRSQRSHVVGRRFLIAASILLACGIALALLRWKTTPHETIVKRDVAPLIRQSQPEMIVTVMGRPPTDLELAQLASAQRDAIRTKAIPIRASAVDQAVALLARDSSSESFEAATNLIRPLEPCRREAELARIALSRDGQKSRAAAGLIAATASADSVPLLMELDRTPATRDAAVNGLARVAWPALLTRLARSHTEPAHRQTLMAGLLRGEVGTAAYLDLVADRATSSDALAALDRVKSPSTGPFFAALHDPHISVRLAAARVLGRIDGPETTARLVALTDASQSRREALIALADSRGPEARRFLDDAKRGGPLAGTVRSILLEQSLNHE